MSKTLGYLVLNQFQKKSFCGVEDFRHLIQMQMLYLQSSSEQNVKLLK